MLSKFSFSRNPLRYVYAVIWLAGFAAFAAYILSGKIFEPQNGKIHIAAILVGWIAEYIGLTLTGLLFLLLGVYRAFSTVLIKKKSSPQTNEL